MTTIRTLFDSGKGKGIDRAIEKVITYAATQEDRLKSEISEYIVTEHIEEQFRKLLDRMERAMDAGGENEIGVWVSGFYGSGKSSFTKYLGFALDSTKEIQGQTFLKSLQDRLTTIQSKQLLNKIATRFPAAVVMLDLASEMVAGATMLEISTVLYYKVLEAFGYSRNLKVAALERRTEIDGRDLEFRDRIASKIPGMTWDDLRNDPFAVDALVPQVAFEMYPAYFPDATSFNTSTSDFFQFETDRVKEMIEIVRRKSGKEHIVFVLDEVGQYVAARDSLILNLDGLAKNLKSLGDGKVWVLATAQQTLTEDEAIAVLNSDKLFKLKDRFPIQITLESSDIREICYRRLLGKTPAGETLLGQRFDTHGQMLRHHTKLTDVRAYSFECDRTTFINLYPFLPAHFDILLNLLSAMAKTTGGVGLRSAIKVVQDILVEEHAGNTPIADQSIGWLATTVTIYNAMVKDIEGAYFTIYKATKTTCDLYPDSSIHQAVAKTIAILQILGNLPATAENIASLIHPRDDAAAQTDEVRSAITDMMNQKDAGIPLTEADGSYKFLSDKLLDIEQQRNRLLVRSVDLRSIINDALKEVFDPLPRAMLQGSSQSCGLKAKSGSAVYGLAGESYPIQLLVQFSDASEYETDRREIELESRDRSSQSVIFLLGRSEDEIQALAEEVSRCKQIAEKHQTDVDRDVRDYCKNQSDRAERQKVELQRKLSQLLRQGSFVFRGNTVAVATLGQDLADAARQFLGQVAEQVFDKYGYAPYRAETTAAEKFLKQAANLKSMSSALDPLNLVKVVKGQPQIDTRNSAIVSIRDYIDHNGTVNGKQLLDHFGIPPFGWSQDTVRYILAAMLVAGEIVLKVSGREIKAATGQQAIDALKTNKSFGSVGVSLRDSKPSNEMLANAAIRLRDLTGEDVIPLEQTVSQEAVRCFSGFQRDYAPLAEKLAGLAVAGADRLRSLNQVLSDVLASDGMDAIPMLGAETSELYESLRWASEVQRSLLNGLETTVREIQRHQREIQDLPDTGVPGELKRSLSDSLDTIRQRLKQYDFYRHSADLQTGLSEIQAQLRSAVQQIETELKQQIDAGVEELERLPEWTELTEDERNSARSRIDQLVVEPTQDLTGLKQVLGQSYALTRAVSDQKSKVVHQVNQRRQQQIAELQEQCKAGETVKLREVVSVPKLLTRMEQLDQLVSQLRAIQNKAGLYSEIEVSIKIQE
jgi:hypothetical protein